MDFLNLYTKFENLINLWKAIEAEEKMLLGKELKLAKKHVKRLSGGAVSGTIYILSYG